MKKMKNLFGGLLLAALLVSVAAAKSPEKEDTAEKLKRIECERGNLTAALSYKTWECYLDYAGRTQTMVDMSKFKGVRLRSLCDTVPALRTLWIADSAAYACWQEVLRTDPEYQSIHDEYISLKGISDREKTNANKQRYNLLYDRLLKNNPDYKPARNAKNRTWRERDEAIARYLLEQYRAQGKICPTEVIDRSLMRTLRQECPVIGQMEQELAILQKLEKELQEQQMREQYGVPRQTKDAGKVSEYAGADRW